MCYLRLWIQIFYLMAPYVAAARCIDRAVIQDGNVVLVNADGSKRRITSSGVDTQPNVSPDGNTVVFVRKVSRDSSQVWVADARGGTIAGPLVKTPLEINKREYFQVFTPKFSPDGQTVYFLIPFASTTQAILRVSISNPVPQFVATALDFSVVCSGKYRGDLIAQLHKAKMAPGYYDWYWLLTPDGKEIGVIGENRGDVDLFLEMYD